MAPDELFKYALALIPLGIATFKWYDKCIKQPIQELQRNDEKQREDNKILIRGVIGCLEGLVEQGCNGPVHSALDELKNHLIDNRY